MTVKETAAKEMLNLLDGDYETCMDSKSLYGTRGHYSGVITWEKNPASDSKINIDLVFNTTVHCRKRKVKIDEITFFLNFCKTQVLFVGPLISLFWSSSDVSPGFQSQDGSLASFIVCVFLRSTSGATYIIFAIYCQFNLLNGSWTEFPFLKKNQFMVISIFFRLYLPILPLN